MTINKNSASKERLFFEAKAFKSEDFSIKPLVRGDYETCIFSDCNFANSDLSHMRFLECTFNNCNLSSVLLKNTSLQNIKFMDCKMLGLRFEFCRDFGFNIDIENCRLDYSSFYQVNLSDTSFRNSQLAEVDFSECNLSGSIFDNCNLLNAKFSKTILEKADLRNAVNFSIDPENNRIKKARFSLPGVFGLLVKYDIKIEI